MYHIIDLHFGVQNKNINCFNIDIYTLLTDLILNINEL